MIDCGDVDCSQVASCDIEGMTYEVGMRYCGKRCDDRLTTSCDDDTALVDGCFCRNGTYENHMVSPTFFQPKVIAFLHELCYFLGRMC